MVVHLPCKQAVVGSSPMEGSRFDTLIPLKAVWVFSHFSKKEKMTLYVPIGKLAKPVPFQGTDTGSNPVGGTNVNQKTTVSAFKEFWSIPTLSLEILHVSILKLYGSVGKLVNPPACHAGDSEFKPRRGRQNVTSYDNGRVVLVNKPFFWQVEDKRTCIMAW